MSLKAVYPEGQNGANGGLVVDGRMLGVQGYQVREVGVEWSSGIDLDSARVVDVHQTGGYVWCDSRLRFLEVGRRNRQSFRNIIRCFDKQRDVRGKLGMFRFRK